jgi:hypothetical protein
VKSEFGARSVALLFLSVLTLYLAGFYGCERVRRWNGPWQVAFAADHDGTPLVVVTQRRVGVESLQLRFAGERTLATNLPQTVIFDRPKKAVPFGRVLFEDLTFLPGVVTFDFFSHEIELLPRVLVVNKTEVPWQSGAVVTLSATNKPAAPPPPLRPR